MSQSRPETIAEMAEMYDRYEAWLGVNFWLPLMPLKEKEVEQSNWQAEGF